LWADLKKMEMVEPFRQLLSKTFGYSDRKPASLYDFLLRLFVTDFCTQLKAEQPTSFSHFNIENPSYATNISVFFPNGAIM
jgi:hypothetical protein